MSQLITTERDSEYQRREQLLRNSELRFRRLFEAAQDGILILDQRTGTVIDANPSLLSMLDYSRAEFVDRKLWELDPFRELAGDAADFEALQTRAQIAEEITLRAKDGQPIPVKFSAKVFDAGAERVVQCHIHDLSNRKRTEAALRENVERTDLILNSALDAVITMDAAGLVTGWSTKAEHVFGWSREESIGQALHSLIIPQRDRLRHQQGLEHFLATGEGPILNRRIELSALHREGHEFPVELAVSPLKTEATFTFSAFLRDISERKRAEAELLRRADEFMVLADTARDLAAEQSLAPLLQTITERAKHLLGVNSGSIYLYDAQRNDSRLPSSKG